MWFPNEYQVQFALAILAGLAVKFSLSENLLTKRQKIAGAVCGIVSAVYLTPIIVEWGAVTGHYIYAIAGLLAMTGDSIMKTILQRGNSLAEFMIDAAKTVLKAKLK